LIDIAPPRSAGAMPLIVELGMLDFLSESGAATAVVICAARLVDK
jgi:hypothetical protein